MGISLAMAGARVTLTDLPHITPFTAQNLALNADKHSLDAQASTWPCHLLQTLPVCMALRFVKYILHAQHPRLHNALTGC